MVAPGPKDGQALAFTTGGDVYPYSGTPGNDGIINALGGEAAQPGILTLSSSSETAFRDKYFALNPLTNEYFQSLLEPNQWYIVEATDPNAEMMVTAIALRSPDNANSLYGSLPIYVEGRTPGTSNWVSIGSIAVDPGRANWAETVVPVTPVLCDAVRFRKETGANNSTLAFSSIEIWGTWGAAGLDPHWEPTDLVSGGVTDHGALTGLEDDDHPQYVKKAGDTLTGNLTIDSPNTAAIIVDKGASSNYAQFEFRTNGTRTWSCSVYPGENLTIARQGALGIVADWDANTGQMAIYKDPTAPEHVAHKGYVDAAVAGSPVSYDSLPAGTTLTVYESGGGYTRPTARTDITVVFVGTVDPAASAIDGVDMWDQI